MSRPLFVRILLNSSRAPGWGLRVGFCTGPANCLKIWDDASWRLAIRFYGGEASLVDIKNDPKHVLPHFARHDVEKEDDESVVHDVDDGWS